MKKYRTYQHEVIANSHGEFMRKIITNGGGLIFQRYINRIEYSNFFKIKYCFNPNILDETIDREIQRIEEINNGT